MGDLDDATVVLKKMSRNRGMGMNRGKTRTVKRFFSGKFHETSVQVLADGLGPKSSP